MNKFITRIQTLLNQARNYLTNHSTTVHNVIVGSIDFIDRIAHTAIRLMITGLILNIVSTHFYPEFADRFPILYGWFDGWLQFGEFAVKGTLGAVNAIFTGTWSDFFSSYEAALQEMWAQFVNWLGQITF